MANSINESIKRAKTVLNRNWSGSYTLPAHGLYPHQWNWDSGFIAIGYAHYNTERAIQELSSLFRAQWKNGMLPQIVFNTNKLGTYFPEPDFWQADQSRNAPEGVVTSGITMPPIHAVAVLAVYEQGKDKKAVMPFLAWIYPRLLAMHRYFYRDRDPEGIGLAAIRHPWESGMDNSPMWDSVFQSITITPADIPPYTRKDLVSGVQANRRPRNKDYDRFVYLVDFFRRHRYEEQAIQEECPFLVYGPLFNAILCASNEALIKIADILKRPAQEPETWYALTAKAIREKLYDAQRGMFNYFNVRENKLIDINTAAGFMPLFCGAASTEQAATLYAYLNSQSFCALHQGDCYTVPNYDTKKDMFERQNYWRGPVWININWLLMKGLRRYGYHRKADSIAKDILRLPLRFGFHEYYDSFDGRGYGAAQFSWTAALFIDTANTNYALTGEQPLKVRLRNMLRNNVILNKGEEQSLAAPESLSQNIFSAIQDMKARFYTDRGTVDYEGIRESGEYKEYKKLTNSLRTFDLALLKTEDEKLAFWINLYNSIVVDGIISLGIQSSVKEVIGFFSKIKYRIGGYEFSPDDIEHGILRKDARPHRRPLKQFGAADPRRKFMVSTLEPRMHFALVCGSRSCAPILFYTPKGIHEELETAAVNFVNSSEVIAIPEENKLLISMIFKWYASDFGGKAGGLDFIEKRLVDNDRKEFIKKGRSAFSIEYLYYDWNLNT